MKYKILVVDDDKELVKMLCSYFNMKQYETITATDGMEALNKIKMKPDIILLDINMPRMDGIEVLRSYHNHMHASAGHILPLRNW